MGPCTVQRIFGFKKQPNIDCDASAILLDANGKLTQSDNVVCFHNKKVHVALSCIPVII